MEGINYREMPKKWECRMIRASMLVKVSSGERFCR